MFTGIGLSRPFHFSSSVSLLRAFFFFSENKATALLNINISLLLLNYFFFSSGGFLIYLWGLSTHVTEKVKERKEYANTAAVIV